MDDLITTPASSTDTSGLFAPDTSQFSKPMLQTAAASDAMSLPEEVAHGAVATVVDIGTSLWNSLTPKSLEASTADILNNLDKDALQVYNEHPDIIQTLSFIGGSALPVGLAVKGMGLLRAGAKGVSFFSEAGATSRLAEVEKLFNDAGAATDAYKAAKNSLYLASAANAIVDNVAIEAAINLTMNAHPFMEDYYKDFGSNFAFSVAVGGVLQGTIGAIATKRLIGDAIKPASQELAGQLDTLVNVPDQSLYQAGKLQIRSNNVDNIEAAIAKAQDPEDPLQLTNYTVSGLKFILTEEKAKLVKDFQEMGSGVIADPKLDPTTRDSFINLLKSPEFAEVDKVEFASVAEPVGASLNKSFLQKTADLIKRTLDKGTGIEKIDTSKVVYSPIYDAFVSKAEAANYLTVADLGKTVDELTASVEKSRGALPRVDNSLEVRAQNSATVDADFAQSVLFASNLNVDELSKLKVAPDDLSMLKGIKARIDSLTAEGVDTSGVSFTLTKAAPSFGASEREALRKQGLNPQYGDQLKALEAKWDNFSLYNGHTGHTPNDVAFNVSMVANEWVRGAQKGIRAAAQLIREPGAIKEPSETMLARKEAIQDMISHPRSVALRDEFSRIADADGNVYLYRGLHSAPSGHRQIESFTTNAVKASEFGAVRLYKVHVDDIIGTVHDYGSRGAEPEILVLPPTREHALVDEMNPHGIPDEFLQKGEDELGSFVVQASNAPTVTRTISGRELGDHIYQEVRNQTLALSREGFGQESIGLRTGTPTATIEALRRGEDVAGAGLFKYTSAGDIEAALAPTNRALALSTTASKARNASVQAGLQIQTGANASDGLVEFYLKSSPSAFIRALGAAVYSDEMRAQRTFIQKGLDQITLTGLGSIFFRSIDSALQGFGTTGALASAFGKGTVNTKNQAIRELVTPIGDALAKVVTDEPALLELNNAINIQAAQKGRLVYRDNAFWTIPDGVKTPVADLLQMESPQFLEAGLTKIQFAGKDFNVATKEVDEALIAMQKAGRDMYHLKNTYYKATGQADLSDRGFWAPALNVRDKDVAYAFDQINRTTTMLVGNTLEELNEGIKNYKMALGQHGANVDIITKDQQAAFNTVAGRHDPMTMAIADVSRQHGGASALSVVPTNTSFLKDLVEGYDSYLNRGIEQLTEVQMAPVMEKLKNLSALSQEGYDPATLGQVSKLLKKPVDPGQVMRNVLLGRNNLGEIKEWAEWQQRGQVFVDRALKAVSDIVSPIISPVTNILSKGGVRPERTANEWAKIEQQMKDRGIVNPFQVLDDALGGYRIDSKLGEATYLGQDKQSTTNLTPRAIVLSNALAATSILRVAEVAQAFVNAVSLPILTSGALSRRLEASFMDASLDPNAKFGMMESMYNGVRLMNHPVEGEKWSKLAEATNLFGADWREVNGILAQSRSFDPGIMTTLENAVESKLVRVLSKPADMSENLVRKMSFFTGVSMAKKAYPGLGDAGVMTFARNFMDESVGNYAAAQRPVAFQGTFGVAMGLFQTYMLTMAQNTYRQIEQKQWAALGKTMLTQSTIFGANSLPGFHPVSEAIAEHFSDQNIDLETGTLRAVSDPLASVALYGLPSQLIGITTRGDIQPRVPNPTNLSSLAAIQLTKQVYDSVGSVASAVGQQDGNTGRAILEALSLQSLSRPIARAAELINGYSITGQGNIVSTANEVYTPNGIISRLMATRPIEEIKAREAMHLNTMYGAIDRDKRVAIAERLRTHIRDGNLDSDTTEKLAFEYMRTGSPTGWRSLVNGAIAESNQPAGVSVRDRLKPSSPVNLMLDDLD